MVVTLDGGEQRTRGAVVPAQKELTAQEREEMNAFGAKLCRGLRPHGRRRRVFLARLYDRDRSDILDLTRFANLHMRKLDVLLNLWVCE